MIYVQGAYSHEIYLLSDCRVQPQVSMPAVKQADMFFDVLFFFKYFLCPSIVVALMETLYNYPWVTTFSLSDQFFNVTNC